MHSAGWCLAPLQVQNSCVMKVGLWYRPQRPKSVWPCSCHDTGVSLLTAPLSDARWSPKHYLFATRNPCEPSSFRWSAKNPAYLPVRGGPKRSMEIAAPCAAANSVFAGAFGL
jgi:hypothetical protein